jgi:RimJ/RimL family protein N-acetyltransferase
MAASKTIKSERLREACLVQRLRDPEEIRVLLRPYHRYAAYGLAQLEPSLFKQSQWWLAEGDGEKALLMHSRGGLGRALLALGDEIGLYVLLSLHPGPVYSFATIEIGHVPVMRRFFSLGHSWPMQRMTVERSTLAETPPLQVEAPDAELRRLSAGDVGAVNRLNSSESGGISYNASQIRDGVYFGIFRDDVLVAMAGTHGVSPTDKIAVLGNVFTHPQHRNSHFALQATGAVTRELLQTCDEVVLTVDPRNEAAVRAYTRLGYRVDCELIETTITRKDSLGLTSLWRRLIARWRGRAQGRELVYSPARRG